MTQGLFARECEAGILAQEVRVEAWLEILKEISGPAVGAVIGYGVSVLTQRRANATSLRIAVNQCRDRLEKMKQGAPAKDERHLLGEAMDRYLAALAVAPLQTQDRHWPIYRDLIPVLVPGIDQNQIGVSVEYLDGLIDDLRRGRRSERMAAGSAR